VAGALLLVGAHPAAAVAPVSYGAVIDAPGVYVLNGNQSGDGNVGITINADNVTLMLGGFTLSGPGIRGIEVHPNAKGVTIRGPGLVTGFDSGILFRTGAEGNTIAGVQATANGRGIEFGPNAKNNRLMDNQASDNSLGMFFELHAANNLLIGNQANDNRYGILFGTGSKNNHLIRNQANGNTSGGIELANGAAGHTGNLVQLNTASGNGVGISLGTTLGAGSSGNTFQLNQALGNGLDLQDFNLPTSANIWRNNEFVSDNETGAAFGPGAGIIR
jgi:parallel beta-helix repeat protein